MHIGLARLRTPVYSSTERLETRPSNPQAEQRPHNPLPLPLSCLIITLPTPLLANPHPSPPLSILHLNHILQPSAISQVTQSLQRLFQRDQLTHLLGGGVVAVTDVDGAGFLFFCADHYFSSRVSKWQTTKKGTTLGDFYVKEKESVASIDSPKMKLYFSNCPVLIFFCRVFPLISMSMYIRALWKMLWISLT